MNKYASLFLLFGLFLSTTSYAEERGTADEAKTLVQKAVALIHEKGAEDAYKEMNEGGPFLDRDLYITITDMNGVVKVHSFNEKLVGKSIRDIIDVDNKSFIRERLTLAKQQKSFMHEYKFPDPLTRQTMLKQAYCEVSGEDVICSAVYKQ